MFLHKITQKNIKQANKHHKLQMTMFLASALISMQTETAE